MKINQKILNKLIRHTRRSLQIGQDPNPDFSTYVHQSGKYQTEINICCQMVMFNRTFEQAVEILNTEKSLTIK